MFFRKSYFCFYCIFLLFYQQNLLFFKLNLLFFQALPNLLIALYLKRKVVSSLYLLLAAFVSVEREYYNFKIQIFLCNRRNFSLHSHQKTFIYLKIAILFLQPYPPSRSHYSQCKWVNPYTQFLNIHNKALRSPPGTITILIILHVA